MQEAFAVFGGPEWNSDHHVGSSKDNSALPKSKRSYFDALPSKIHRGHGEFADVLALQPNETPELISAASSPPAPRGLGRAIRMQLPLASPKRGGPARFADDFAVVSCWAMDARGDQADEPRPAFFNGRLLPRSWALVPEHGGGAAEEAARRAAAGARPASAAHSAASSGSRPASEGRPRSCLRRRPPPGAAGAPRRPATTEAKPARGRRRNSAVQTAMADLPSAEDLQNFVRWVEARKWPLVMLWRKLDKDGSMSLHKGEFAKGLKELKYDSDIERLWLALDRDTTGTISFTEFCPEGALSLARFKRWATQTFGGMQALFRALDQDHSGQISLPEFVGGLRAIKGFPPELATGAENIFAMLDSDEGNGRGGISVDELAFLDKWRCPPYFWAEPDLHAKERFFAALVRRHDQNPLLAWRKVLDRDCSMRVSFEEFIAACTSLARAGLQEATPSTGVPRLYCAFDEGRSGWFSLRDWSREGYEALYNFQKLAKARSGKVSNFIKSLPQEGNLITGPTFRIALRELGCASIEIALLFDALFAFKGRQVSISPADVGFLDRWDPDKEMEEERAWKTLVAETLGK